MNALPIKQLAQSLAMYIMMKDRLAYLKERQRLTKAYGREVFVDIQAEAIKLAKE